MLVGRIAHSRETRFRSRGNRNSCAHMRLEALFAPWTGPEAKQQIVSAPKRLIIYLLFVCRRLSASFLVGS